MMDKSFTDYWAEIEKLHILPEMAIRLLPGTLSEHTKKKLMKIRPEDTVNILKNAIDKVNR